MHPEGNCQIAARHGELLACRKRPGFAAVPVHDGTASRNGQLRQAGGRIGLHLVLTGLPQHDGEVGGTELDALACHVVAHPHLHAAALQGHAQRLVAQF